MHSSNTLLETSRVSFVALIVEYYESSMPGCLTLALSFQVASFSGHINKWKLLFHLYLRIGIICQNGSHESTLFFCGKYRCVYSLIYFMVVKRARGMKRQRFLLGKLWCFKKDLIWLNKGLSWPRFFFCALSHISPPPQRQQSLSGNFTSST